MYTFLQNHRLHSLATGIFLVLMACGSFTSAQTVSPAASALVLAPTPAEPKLAIVLNSAEASVSLIDMPTRKVIKTVPVGKEPHHLMLTPDQKTLLIANAAGNDVQLMNPVNGELTGKIPEIIDPVSYTHLTLPTN